MDIDVVSIATSSNAMADDQLGPGRLLNNLLDMGGKHLDWFTDHIFNQPAGSHSTNFNATHLPHVNQQLQIDTISIATGSINTKHDASAVGVGRSLGVLLSAGGQQLDKTFSQVAARLEHGPNALISCTLHCSAELCTLPDLSLTCHHTKSIWETLQNTPRNTHLPDMLDYLSAPPALLCASCRDTALEALVLHKDIEKACSCDDLSHGTFFVFLLCAACNLFSFLSPKVR
jgi:hypothetical protein